MAFRTIRSTERALQFFLVGCALVVGFVVYNFYSGSLLGNRATIADADQNEIALVLALGMAVSWYLATASVTLTRSFSLLRLAYLAYQPLALLAIFMTGSRGGFISTLPVLIYMFVSFGRVSFVMKAIVISVLLAGGYFVYQNLPEAQFERIAETSEELSTGEISGRGDLWSNAYYLWSEDVPTMLAGIGVGNFRNNVGAGVHNTHLSILTETGMVGFLFYFSILMLLLIAVHRSKLKDVRLFLYSFIACWGVGATALTWEYRKTTWFVWTITLCLAVAVRENNRSKGKERYNGKRSRRPSRQRIKELF